MHSKYRPDIDGLRAVAVIAVILFHLHVSGFSGGYVGVDIFFVISGYLITGLIYGDMNSQQFTIKGFYIRRIRRLMPALLTTLFAVSVFTYFVLKPEEMRSFGLSLTFQSVSMQNVFFLSEGEYFLGSDLKPLLHTWSLAVEEQFYLFWPLLLLFIRRYSFKAQILMLVVILLCSFAINITFMKLSPKASFFLLPSRAWELSLGGLIALFETRTNFREMLSHRLRSILGVVGLAIVSSSFFIFTAATPFPGWTVLLPVWGAALLLVSGIGSSTVVGRVLSFRPVVFVGLISYPMYLWHWPIIVAMRQFGVAMTPSAILAAILATVALSAATYKYIESPIRSRKWLPTTKLLLSCVAVGIGILTVFGVHTWLTDGASYRYTSVARSLLTAPLSARTSRCGMVFKVLHPRDQVCALHGDTNATRRVLLWGNSHADHWSGLFADLASESGSAFYLNARNCRATPDHEFCGTPVQKAILSFIESERITDVVLASTGYGAYEVPDGVFENNLKNLVKQLAGNRIRTWLVIDVPSGDELSPITAFNANPTAPALGSITLSQYLKTKKRELDLYDSLSHTYGDVHVVDPSRNLCDSEHCFGGKEGVVWYRDSGHLTDAGAKAAREQFQPIFFSK
jgi:peptidoglycan/LPS O-acetylase OafA/YrhL